MPDGGEAITLKVVGGMADVEAARWDACAGAANPFVGHAFLLALEESRSVGRAAGWLPYHLLAEDAAGVLVGAVPLYVKSHSQGEYVFDHGWAQAYEQAGGRYYPKLQAAVPFTPVPGPRLLVRPGPEAAAMRSALIAGLATVAERTGVSSLHVTFPDATDAEALRQAGFLMRTGCQYHWTNAGYGSFDDFLGALSSRKRKAIRREREAVRAHGLRLHALSGDAIEPRHWDAFHRCYRATGNSKWGRPYLTCDFFHRLGAAMADRVLLVMAEHDGRLVAGALNLIGADALYGRNWGCLADFPFLHFEACYYQAIDFAIARGLARVEAGAQGEHKIQRGYLPVHTWSAHWIADAGFAAAVEEFLVRERGAIEHEMQALAELSPFRKCDGPAEPPSSV
jgi:hypothetical protein